MTKSSRRNQILKDLRKEANGSFSTVYKALSEESAARQSSSLKKDDVKQRIKKIISSRTLANAG